MTEKQKALHALQDLPDDATVEDAIERLRMLVRVNRGLAELDAGRGVGHDEARRRIVGG